MTNKFCKKNATISNFEMVQKEGNRNLKRNVDFYNLDAVIAVGYRIHSKAATRFRIWAINTILTLSTCYDDKVVLYAKLIKKITSCYFFLYL